MRTNGATRFIIKCLEGDLFSDDAAEILGKLKTKKAVMPLVKALNENESDATRWEAAEALGEIGDKRAVDSLIKALNNSKNDTIIS